MLTPTKRAGKLFVISAPSGGGKTSLTEAVLRSLKENSDKSRVVNKIITYTTRPQRVNERNGIDYCFITREDFLEKIQSGFFLETTIYDGHYYGSPASIRDDLKEGKSFILITDRPGARKISQLIKDAVSIWIIPPNMEVLENRLITRGTESPEHLMQRIGLAHQEMDDEEHSPFFKYKIINDSFEQATEALCDVIIRELKS